VDAVAQVEQMLQVLLEEHMAVVAVVAVHQAMVLKVVLE
jgi:hypothetical protein